MRKLRYQLLAAYFLLLLQGDVFARVRPNGSRLWDFAKETIEQEADYIITQADIPLTINLPGVYRLAESINAVGTAVITINSNDVVLDLNGKVISGNTTGVFIGLGVSNIIVENGFILGSPFNDGINVAGGSSHLTFQDLEMRFFGSPMSAITIFDSSVITIARCTLSDAIGDLITMVGCNKVIIQDSSMSNAVANAINLASVNNAKIENCTMDNVFNGLLMTGCTNCLIEDSSATNIGQFGYSLVSSTTNLLRNCTVLGLAGTAAAQVTGYSSLNGVGNIFEKCVVDGVTITDATIQGLATGFILANGEQCSKIIGCQATNCHTQPTGFAHSYGIYLRPSLSAIQTVTSNSSAGTLQHGVWSPSGDFIAVSSFSVAPNLRLFEYNRTSNTVTLNSSSTPAIGGLLDVVWHPSENYIACSGTGGLEVLRFDKVNKILGAVTASIASVVQNNKLSWSADGRFLAAGTSFGLGINIEIYQFNQTTGALTLIQSAAQGTANVNAIEWSPDGNFLAAGDSTGDVDIYSFNKNANSFALTLVASIPTAQSVNDLAWSFDQNYLAIARSSNLLLVYQFDSTTFTTTFINQVSASATYLSCQWSADGNYLLATNNPNVLIYAFNRQTGALTLAQSFNLPLNDWARWAPDNTLLLALTLSQLEILSGLTFPRNNVIANNLVYCNTGSLLGAGVGIAGSSLVNMITGNKAYNNSFNYQFVTNVYNQGLTGSPTLLQNISIPPA